MSKERTGVEENIIFEDVKLIWTNFAGNVSEFNKNGERNFAVVIENIEEAKALMDIGWNVRIRESKDPEAIDEQFATLSVAVTTDPYMPKIIMLVESEYNPDEHIGTVMSADMLSIFDTSEIMSATLEVRPYNYPSNGVVQAGTKAYLKEGYIVIRPKKVQLAAEAKYNIVF